MRRSFIFWHRWFGLLGAAWLFLLGLTGAILVFYEEIDHAINPTMFTASAGPSQPIGRITGAALAGRPEYYVRYLNLPDESGDVAEVHLSRRPDLPTIEGHVPGWEVTVDPATARVLGFRDTEGIDLSRTGIMAFLYTFHYSLHAGDWVTWTIGLVAFLWMLDHVVAAMLSFPTATKWRESFRIRPHVSGHKRTFDLHRAGGLWLFPVTLTLAVTGVYFNWHDEFKAVVGLVSPVSERPDEVTPILAAPLVAPAIGFDRALASAGKAKVDGVAYNAAKGLYWLRIFDARDIDKYGRRWLFVDARDGRIVADKHATDGTAGDVIMAWQFPLHSGKAFGWWGRIAIFLTGIAVCVFTVTGVMIWNRKRWARLRQANRSRPTGARIIQPAE